MADPAQRSGLLEGIDFEAANSPKVQVRTAMPRVLVNLRGRPEDEHFLSTVLRELGVALPDAPNRWTGNGETAILWLGPDEWMIMDKRRNPGEIEAGIRAAAGADPWLSLVDVSHSYTGMELSGADSRNVLAKGCPIDLHSRAFGPGDCAQTLLAKSRALLRHTESENQIEIWVRNSFARYIAAWLIDAMAEYH